MLVSGIGRTASQWEETLYDLTPVEHEDGLVFKREDKFAPLGYGCINGAKLRQLIWLIHRYLETYSGPVGQSGLVSGASIYSPQLTMGSAVANHFGIGSTHVIGLNQFGNIEKAKSHLEYEMSELMGAKFIILNSARNNHVQKKVGELLHTPEYQHYFHLEYGVSLDHRTHRASAIEAFHRVGAEQVRNIPECDTLIIPSGSCNSLVSILYGLAIWRPKIRKLALVEIGPNRRGWVKDRLIGIQVAIGSRYQVAGILGDGSYEIEYHDLHRTGYVKYETTMRYQHGDIEFHPRYEGKVMTYLADQHPEYLNADNVIWVIAGEGRREAFLRALDRETVAV